eukprot:PhF_6_TR30873/c0_g1_i1/m.45433/K17427/MRPL46; large subunit ribosomal protein L46
MFKSSSRAMFRPQRNMPVYPQRGVWYSGPKKIEIGYVLTRPQVVKSDPHPMEQEASWLLEQEYNRYGRHGEESPQTFLKNRGVNLDPWNRDDSSLRKNFFNLEAYGDAYRTVISTWQPGQRLTDADFQTTNRKTLLRSLSDCLYLIVIPKGSTTGKWVVPAGPRKDGESLRMSVERLIFEHHGDGVDYTIFSNAPQGVHNRGGDKNAPTFYYVANYLEGRPSLEENFTDHAWVTRQELLQYSFEDMEMKQLLYDITIDGTGDVIDRKV